MVVNLVAEAQTALCAIHNMSYYVNHKLTYMAAKHF